MPVLWTVIAINGAMFLTEMTAGSLAGSQALKADALDFLADTVTYGLSLAVIGASLRTRATAALFKGLSLSLMALWVFGSTVYQTLILGVPTLKLRGDYLAIVTIAAAEILRYVGRLAKLEDFAGAAQGIPGSQYRELPATPHMQSLEHPELVAAALDEFLPAERSR